MTFPENKAIDVLYTYAGQKLSKTVKDNGAVAYKQDYVGGLEYRTAGAGSPTLEAIYTAEGRITPTSGGG